MLVNRNFGAVAITRPAPIAGLRFADVVAHMRADAARTNGTWASGLPRTVPASGDTAWLSEALSYWSAELGGARDRGVRGSQVDGWQEGTLALFAEIQRRGPSEPRDERFWGAPGFVGRFPQAAAWLDAAGIQPTPDGRPAWFGLDAPKPKTKTLTPVTIRTTTPKKATTTTTPTTTTTTRPKTTTTTTRKRTTGTPSLLDQVRRAAEQAMRDPAVRSAAEQVQRQLSHAAPTTTPTAAPTSPKGTSPTLTPAIRKMVADRKTKGAAVVSRRSRRGGGHLFDRWLKPTLTAATGAAVANLIL